MHFVRAHGRFIVAAAALAIAFVLSVRFSDRGVQFDLRNTTVSASESKDGVYDLAALKILNRVLLQIKDNYVEPERIDPNKMLVYALDEIQNSIAEVVVDFDKPLDAHPSTVLVAVNTKSKKFQIGEIESLWEMSFRLKEIFHFVQQNLAADTDVEYQEVEYAAINGMLTTLDPHSTLLPPQHYEEMQTQTGGKFGGLGIVISIRPPDGKLTVISPIDGTPASRAGIKAGDHIVRIGEESTINMNLNEAVNMLRGEPGSDVDLWIQRKGWSEPKKFTVTRAIIKIESVDSEPLKNKIGYLRIKNFQANTYSDMKTHLGELKEKMGGLQGLVLDLRDNPGGLLDQAIKVSDLFLSEGTIVSTVGVGNRLREKRDAKSSGSEPEYPIIVLVNAGSASASEIVSGALQNHNRAVILGDTTFGKGTVQVLYEFPDNSALKLTVAQYLTPGGISIQSKGIRPDLRVMPVTISDEEVDMFASQNIVRESDLDSHLTNDAVRKEGAEGVEFVPYLQKEPPGAANGGDEPEAESEEFVEDFEIKLAQRLLIRAAKVWKRPEMIEQLQPELKKVAASEFEVIRKELRKVGVDWSRGASATTANLEVKLSSSVDAEALKAGDKLEMTATVTNRGTNTLHQLKAISKSDHGVLDDREFIFGKLAPNQTKMWSVSVTIPKDAPSRHDVVELLFSDEESSFVADASLGVTVVGNKRPKFGFSYEVSDASGDGVLSPGEAATLRVQVKNIGEADSAETLVYLKNLARDAVYLRQGRAKLKSIAAQKAETVDFEFDVREQPPEGKPGIELEVDIYDTTFREYTEKKFVIPFAIKDSKATPATGTATVSGKSVKIFAAANAEADTAAVAGAGAVLPVSGKVGEWLKVGLPGRSGWVQSEFVKFDAGSSAELAGLTRDVMFQPPSILFTPDVLHTTKGKVALKGRASDDSGIKDYYIFVYNRDNSKLNTRKLKYVRAGDDDIPIAANVPLFKGMNRIAIVARDDQGMITTESAYVYRQ